MTKRFVPFLLALLLSAIFISSALASPVSNARSSFEVFIQDVFTGNSVTCSLADTHGQAEILHTGRQAWVIKNYVRLGRSGQSNAQITKDAEAAVPNCAVAVTVFAQAFHVTQAQIDKSLQTVAKAPAKKLNNHTVEFLGSPPPLVMVLQNGRWLMHSGFVLT